MGKTKNSKGTPSKETGAKNNNSDNDVDYKNSNQNSTSNKANDKRCKQGSKSFPFYISLLKTSRRK